ncbi:hypothetical protein [Streptomyces griseorubiginosus]|uniref:hypothetical protein n=1 Tax=Streptomyces griseorubiginosus TaxID=67304 RepID=UPI0033C9AB27
MAMLDFPELDVPFRKMISPLNGCEVSAAPVFPWDPVSAGAAIIFPRFVRCHVRT